MPPTKDGEVERRSPGNSWQETESFRVLVDGIHDYAIFLLDSTGQVLTWNAGAQRIKQYTRDEIVGRPFSLFYPPEDVAAHKPERELAVAIDSGRYEEEGWRVRKDGSRFWANVVITALRDERGAVRGFAKVTRDLSQRWEDDEKLRHSEMQLRLLIESIHDYAIFMLDTSGRVATWNGGAQRIKGYRKEEIIGRHFSVFYPQTEVEASKCDRELDVAAASGRFEDEGWRIRQDGSRFWASVVINAVRDHSGKLVGFAKVTRDLTDRREAEQERIRLARAEEALRIRDDFLSIASHELKTPLTSLQLQVSGIQRIFAKGAADPPTFDKLVSRTALVARELDRMSQLINDLLDVTRAASGTIHLEPRNVNLSEVARAVATRFREQLAEAGCELSLHLDEDLVGLWDLSRVDQVITNLVSNALKYGAGKPIDLTLARQADQAVLTVQDRGIGIAPEDQRRIFERFERAVTPDHYGGLGLGLWIVRILIDAMNGTVRVQSDPGAGATFVVTLPLGL